MAARTFVTSGAGRLGLAPVASGLLLALAGPPFSAGPLVFVALVPFALHTSGLAGARDAARSGLLLGVAFFGVLLHWITFSLPGQPLLGVAAYGAAVSLLALAPAAAGWMLHGLSRGGAQLWVALPLSWTAGEWARGALPGGLAFPWGGGALALAGTPRSLALLPWGGELGVTFWIALVNGLIATAVVKRGTGRSAPPAVAAVAAALLPLALGAPHRTDGSLDGSRRIRVAILQTAVPVEVREHPAAGAEAMGAAVERLLAPLEPGSVDLVVLPETAFPLLLEAPEGRTHLDALRSASSRLGAPLLVGAFGLGDVERPSNSLFLVDERGVAGRYDKRRLVPVIERNPLASSRALEAMGDTTSYEVGVRRPPLDVDGARVGALICFESAFGGLARELRRDGAELLVNATNDAWFGGAFAGNAARAQHEAHAVLRALEARTAVVRVANGGRSLWIDLNGRVTPVAPVGEEGVAVAAVPLAGAPPPTLALQGLMGPACAGAGLLLLLVALRRRRSGPRSPAPLGPVSQAAPG